MRRAVFPVALALAGALAGAGVVQAQSVPTGSPLDPAGTALPRGIAPGAGVAATPDPRAALLRAQTQARARADARRRSALVATITQAPPEEDPGRPVARVAGFGEPIGGAAPAASPAASPYGSYYSITTPWQQQ